MEEYEKEKNRIERFIENQEFKSEINKKYLEEVSNLQYISKSKNIAKIREKKNIRLEKIERFRQEK